MCNAASGLNSGVLINCKNKFDILFLKPKNLSFLV